MRYLRFGVITLCLALGACRTTATVAQFDDIPVPDGLKLMADNQSHSVAWADAEFRHGEFRYDGRRSATEIEAFLVERMPQFGWRLRGREVAEESGNPVAILRFRRSPDNAVCYVEDVEDEFTQLKILVTTVTEVPSIEANQ